MPSSSEYIVVGLDGSDAAVDAANWAADEASRRDSEVRLVHAYWLPANAGYPDDSAYPDDLAPVLRDAGQRMVDQTAAELRRTHPELTTTTKVLSERATVALRDESAHAQLTVVGSGDSGRLYGVLLGSVALAVASTNPVPVAVIHREQMPRLTGPVVVGVDGSHTSDAAVDFAFQAAARRSTNLVAVHVWDDVFVPGSHRLQKHVFDSAHIEQEERALLAERIARWACKYPDVSVQQELAQGRAVTTLLEYAQRAQLLVVGSHGRGGFAGMLLGSTSHSLIIHSSCPVIVVRTDSTD